MANVNTDALGFTRMEIANVRRCYAANKQNYTKLNKLYQKVAELKTQIDAVTEAIKTWDMPARNLAKEKLGMELTSEEIMIGHNNPEELYTMHPELRNSDNADTEAEVASIQEEEAEDTEDVF